MTFLLVVNKVVSVISKTILIQRRFKKKTVVLLVFIMLPVPTNFYFTKYCCLIILYQI